MFHFKYFLLRAIVRSWKLVKARYPKNSISCLSLAAGLPGLIYFKRFRFAGQEKRYRALCVSGLAGISAVELSNDPGPSPIRSKNNFIIQPRGCQRKRVAGRRRALSDEMSALDHGVPVSPRRGEMFIERGAIPAGFVRRSGTSLE